MLPQPGLCKHTYLIWHMWQVKPLNYGYFCGTTLMVVIAKDISHHENVYFSQVLICNAYLTKCKPRLRLILVKNLYINLAFFYFQNNWINCFHWNAIWVGDQVKTYIWNKGSWPDVAIIYSRVILVLLRYWDVIFATLCYHNTQFCKNYLL